MRKLHIIIIYILFGVLSVSAQDTKHLREQLKLANEMLSYFPDSTDLRLRKAALNIELQEWEYAKNEYDYILDRHPDNISALFYRAYVNERLLRYAFARQDYEYLLALVPGNMEAQLGLALLNQKDKRYTEAMDMMNQLVEKHPKTAMLYAARGNMERERGMYSLAEYDYTIAMELAPKNTDYIVNRADVRILQGLKKEALSDLKLLEQKGINHSALKDFYKRVKKLKDN